MEENDPSLPDKCRDWQGVVGGKGPWGDTALQEPDTADVTTEVKQLVLQLR